MSVVILFSTWAYFTMVWNLYSVGKKTETIKVMASCNVSQCDHAAPACTFLMPVMEQKHTLSNTSQLS